MCAQNGQAATLLVPPLAEALKARVPAAYPPLGMFDKVLDKARDASPQWDEGRTTVIAK